MACTLYWDCARRWWWWGDAGELEAERGDSGIVRANSRARRAQASRGRGRDGGDGTASS